MRASTIVMIGFAVLFGLLAVFIAQQWLNSQAEMRMQGRAAARIARILVDRFWAPVGSGVQPDEELRFLATYLFAGPEGRAAARKVDARLFEVVPQGETEGDDNSDGDS